MPINHFANRPESSRIPSKLNQGDIVMIIQKENQGSRNVRDLVTGKINRILSKGDRYENGAKVEIILSPLDWRFQTEGYRSYIGRVQYIVKQIKDEKGDRN